MALKALKVDLQKSPLNFILKKISGEILMGYGYALEIRRTRRENLSPAACPENMNIL